MKSILVKTHDPDISPIKIIPNGDWIDLRSAEEVTLEKGESKKISLGVSMKLPEGYEAYLIMRSSTFGKYGVIQTNGMGIIDNSYSGDNDIWLLSVYATRDTVIPKNERIAQFRIMKRQEEINITYVDHLSDKDRGGFGSTDSETTTAQEPTKSFYTTISIPLDSVYQEQFVYLKRAVMNELTQQLLARRKLPVYFFDSGNVVGFVTDNIQLIECTKCVEFQYVDIHAQKLVLTAKTLFFHQNEQLCLSPIIEQNSDVYTYGKLTGFKLTLESMVDSLSEYVDISLEALAPDICTGMVSSEAAERILTDMGLHRDNRLSDQEFQVEVLVSDIGELSGVYRYFSGYITFDGVLLHIRFHKDDVISMINHLSTNYEIDDCLSIRQKNCWMIQYAGITEETRDSYLRILLSYATLNY